MPHRPGHNPGIKIDILEADQARTGAINEQSNAIVQTMAVTRPKTPDEKNLELLQEYERRGLPLPRTAGTDLNATNEELERRLNDPVYAGIQRDLSEAQRQSRELFRRRGAGRALEVGAVIGVGPVLGGATVAASAIGAEVAERTGVDPNIGAAVGEVSTLGPAAATKLPAVARGVKTGVKKLVTIINDEEVLLTGNKSMDKLIQGLAHAKKSSVKTDRLREVEAQQLAQRMERLRQKAIDAGDSAEAEKWRNMLGAARRGERAVADFEIPEFLKMSDGELNDIFTTVLKSKRLSTHEATNAGFAIRDMYLTGRVPQAAELDSLAEVFGPGFRMFANRFRTTNEKTRRAILNVMGMPITTLSSFDMSAPFRQGYFLMARMPVQGAKNMGRMSKAFFSEEYAQQLDIALHESQNFRRFKRAGAFFGDIGTAAGTKVAGRSDEMFGKFIRASERAYTTFLNQMRYDYMNGIYKGWKGGVSSRIPLISKAPRVVTKKDLQQLAQLANYSTGRGPGLGVDALNDIAQVGFYAPKLATSRFALPAVGIGQMTGIVKASSAMRWEQARILAQGFGAMLTVGYGLQTGANIVEKRTGKKPLDVQMDPRSSDFGKIKVGAARIDMNAGFSQVFRFMAQLVANQTKTTGTGAVLDTELTRTIGRFLRSKASPAAGIGIDIAEQETFVGEEIEGDVPGIGNLAWERLAPLFWQDVKEAMEVEGIIVGGASALPGFIGGGVTTFKNSRDIANEALHNRIEMTDENGERIYDIQDERMTPAQRSQLFTDPEIRRGMDEAQKKTRDDYLISSSKLRGAQQLARDENLTRGTMPGSQWRSERLIQNMVAAEVVQVRQILEGNARSEKAFGGVAGWVANIIGKNEPDRTSQEKALLEWYEIFDRHVIDPEAFDSIEFDPSNATSEELAFISKGVDLDGLQRERDSFMAGLSKKNSEYVLENTNPSRTPVEDVYLRGQRTLREYWDVPKEAASSPAQLALYEEWLSLPPNQQRAFAIRNPSVRRLAARVDIERRRIRLRNKEVDELLVTFYDVVPQHRELVREGRAGFNTERIKQRVLEGADVRLDESLNLKGIQR